MKQSLDSKGFTLIELSIVLVIIALIAGAVLVGRDLIREAELRATIAQIEKYNAAANTFLAKYDALPGDMHPSTAAALGMFQFTGSNAGTIGMGNNNKRYDDVTGVSMPRGEHLIFWRHLGDAGMLDGYFSPDGSVDPATGRIVNDVSAAGASLYLPQAKIGSNNRIRVYSSIYGENNFQIAGVPGMAAAGFWGGPYSSGTDRAIIPQEAYRIDIKMDDGISSRGQVRGGGVVSGAGAVGICMIGNGQYHEYNIPSSSGGTQPACTMQFRMW